MAKSAGNNEQNKAFFFEYEREMAVAFKADVEDFLLEFEKLQSLNYADFVKVWQQKSFTYVYAGQKYAVLLKELCENYFYIVKKFLMFPMNIYTQIGAFYMLYGLYYKQPLKNWVKIRLTLDEYNVISSFIDEMKLRQQHEAVFIFAKMKNEQAFTYTALRKPLGPEDRFVKSFELYYDDTFRTQQSESALTKFKENIHNCDVIVDLKKTNNEYQECLKKYAAKDPSFAPFTSTIVQDLQDAFTRVETGTTSLQNKQQIQEQTIKSIRKSIRDKAMGSQNAVYRGCRKVKVATDADLWASSDSD